MVLENRKGAQELKTTSVLQEPGCSLFLRFFLEQFRLGDLIDLPHLSKVKPEDHSAHDFNASFDFLSELFLLFFNKSFKLLVHVSKLN